MPQKFPAILLRNAIHAFALLTEILSTFMHVVSTSGITEEFVRLLLSKIQL